MSLGPDVGLLPSDYAAGSYLEVEIQHIQHRSIVITSDHIINIRNII
jgi:hypothetical protein